MMLQPDVKTVVSPGLMRNTETFQLVSFRFRPVMRLIKSEQICRPLQFLLSGLENKEDALLSQTPRWNGAIQSSWTGPASIICT